MNHGDTENTEAKQKECSHFRKNEFQAKTWRRKEKDKRRKFSSRLNEQFEIQFIADDARNSLRHLVFASVFSSVTSASLWLIFLFGCGLCPR